MTPAAPSSLATAPSSLRGAAMRASGAAIPGSSAPTSSRAARSSRARSWWCTRRPARPLGFALYSPRSEIRLRMVARGETLSAALPCASGWTPRSTFGPRSRPGPVPAGWCTARATAALAGRRPLRRLPRRADALAGHGGAQGRDRGAPGRAPRRRRASSSATTPRCAGWRGSTCASACLHGEVPETVDVEEGGVRFEADLWKGQKTGLFLDQRENHVMARGYARGRVLDAFTYNGGFALQAARAADCGARGGRFRGGGRAGAAERRAQRHRQRRDPRRQLLRPAARARRAGERFDTVILDPPAFAKSKVGDREGAGAGTRRSTCAP